MKVKLDKAWITYQRRWVTGKWFLEAYPDNQLGLSSRVNSRIKFEKYARKLCNNNNQITFEWQENGDCIVAGVIYFILEP